MRITTNSVYIPYQRNVAELQESVYREQIRLNTGKYLVSVSDSPDRLADTKKFTTEINNNEAHINVIDDALAEMRVVDEQLENVLDKLISIRQLAIESSATGNMGNLYSMGVYVKGLLDDIVNDANLDFKGRFLFSGTKTTPDSLDNDAKIPYVLVEGEPTEDNLSGLSVEFNGNDKGRRVNKDKYSDERINILPSELFGESATEIFQPIINLYNIFTYDSEGNKRDENSKFTKEELGLIDGYQKEIADFHTMISNASSHNGGKMARLEAIQTQMTYESSILKDIRSLNEDTNVTESVIQLKKDETALQYSMRIGSQMIPVSLFDFLG